MRASSRSITFATGNLGKIQEARIILSPFRIRPLPFDGKGVEVQASTVSEVASYSARVASRRCGRALIVEDSGLFVEALNGFPGPFSSYVFKTVGIAGLVRLLEGQTSRRASFRSAVAFCAPTGEPVVFDGAVAGRILRVPVGSGGFGFDPVFVPDGRRKSMAQMTLEEKCQVSHRGEAMRKFASWFIDVEP
jgi:XTP/dITP diphosphohydrolase